LDPLNLIICFGAYILSSLMHRSMLPLVSASSAASQSNASASSASGESTSATSKSASGLASHVSGAAPCIWSSSLSVLVDSRRGLSPLGAVELLATSLVAWLATGVQGLVFLD
jgi:hypothetical protein